MWPCFIYFLCHKPDSNTYLNLDFSLNETPEFQAQWSTCCSLNKLCLQLFSTCTFVQAVPSVENDFPPLSLILFISFSLFHSSRPNMQTNAPMKLPSISWVQLSLLWTNRRIWYSLKIAPCMNCLVNCSIMCQAHFPKCWGHPGEQYVIFSIKDLLGPRKPPTRSYPRSVVRELQISRDSEGAFWGWGNSVKSWRKWGIR